MRSGAAWRVASSARIWKSTRVAARPASCTSDSLTVPLRQLRDFFGDGLVPDPTLAVGTPGLQPIIGSMVVIWLTLCALNLVIRGGVKDDGVVALMAAVGASGRVFELLDRTSRLPNAGGARPAARMMLALRDKDGKSALLYACRDGHVDSVRLLLRAHAFVEVVADGYCGGAGDVPLATLRSPLCVCTKPLEPRPALW